ncbi:alpha/beta hydrolase family protein [Aspergillus affinis]|uniref:alpha/beta hydrolase family protein n=1 Tax=Aspergillus affinis TaxID=1070780 RepID=UPI0022FEA371|nr:uncharacterized protein KD926_010219 [Aspergillus affinis]KAI9038886.1 hypothetical protein KD926_010219 [Aspergillus affinis]
MFFCKLVALLGLMTGTLTDALDPANFNLSFSTMQQYGCDKECQRIFALAQSEDRKQFGTDFDFDFYATSPHFNGSRPGDLLKFEPVNPTTLDIVSGVSVYRFQYTSQSLNSTLVPATGFIAIPYASTRNDKKYKVIAYAHGTIGVFRGCPPSREPTLYEYGSWSPLINRGYAVVATDYAGLGNDYIDHEYLSFPAHANDLYYSMVAARQAFPTLFTQELMSVGLSQGGGAVWKLSESPLHQTGTAGSSNPSSYDIIYEIPWLPIALQRAFPRQKVPMLGKKLMERVELATQAQTCYYGISSLMYGLQPSDILGDTGITEAARYLQEWQNRVAPGQGAKATGPIMIVQGLNDTAVLPDITVDAYRDTCRHGNEAHLRLYGGLDHSGVFPASAVDWLSFIDDHFTHPNRTCARCSNLIRVPFDPVHMVSAKESDEITQLFS